MSKIYFSKRTEITQQEYLMLLGLKTLAMEHERRLLNLKKSVGDIFQEVDQEGNLLDDPVWAGELVYTEREVDEVLKILDIKVLD